MIKKLKYLDIDYTEKDLEYIDEICNVIDEKSEDIVNFFELKEFNEKVNVKLFSNLENFRNFYKETYHREPKDYVCGFSKGNSVFTLSLSEYKKCLSHEESTIDDLERLILHEFTHSVHSKRHSNMMVKWINEGAATYLSGQHRDKKEITCNYDELLENKIYLIEEAIVQYVFDKYGKEYILKLIDNEELLNKETKRLFEEIKLFNNLKTTEELKEKNRSL